MTLPTPDSHTFSYQGLPTYLQMNISHLVLNKCAAIGIFEQINIMFNSENDHLIQNLK